MFAGECGGGGDGGEGACGRQVICGIYGLIFLGTSLSAKMQTVAEGSTC